MLIPNYEQDFLASITEQLKYLPPVIMCNQKVKEGKEDCCLHFGSVQRMPRVKVVFGRSIEWFVSAAPSLFASVA